MPDQDTPSELSPEEIELIQKRRANPMMAAGLDLVMKQFDEEIAKGVDAHQAEESALKLLRQLGQTMLGQWAQHTESHQLTEEQSQDFTLQKHAKKNSSGIPPSAPSS